MTIKGAPTDRVIRQNPAPINRPGPVSWIPAFAGMTQGLKSGICQEWQRGCRDGNPLFPSSLSFRRRLAYMKVICVCFFRGEGRRHGTDCHIHGNPPHDK